MQYPRTSKTCRRLTKLAHRLGVPGVVRKSWSAGAGARGGARSEFVLERDGQVPLGTSRQVAEGRLRDMAEERSRERGERRLPRPRVASVA
jgi:hypothetical protein